MGIEIQNIRIQISRIIETDGNTIINGQKTIRIID